MELIYLGRRNEKNGVLTLKLSYMKETITFKQGEAVSVDDDEATMLIKENPHMFMVGGVVKEAAKALEDEEVKKIKAELDELGVEYHPRSGKKKLNELLEEALNKGVDGP